MIIFIIFNEHLLLTDHQERRILSLNTNVDRRHTISQNFQHNTDRRHLTNMSDRRHISPPLHINICENSPTILNANQNEGLHQRNIMDFPQRRHGRGNFKISFVIRNGLIIWINLYIDNCPLLYFKI